MSNSISDIKASITSGQPVTQIISYEEKRVESALRQFAKQIYGSDQLTVWDINTGLCKGDAVIPETQDPVLAFDHIINQETAGFFVFRDLPPLLNNSHLLQRKLRDVYYLLKNSKRFIFILSPDDQFPDVLKKELDIIFFNLPEYDELESLAVKFLETHRQAGRVVNLNPDQIKELIIALQGLTLDEAYKALKKAYYGKNDIDVDGIPFIHQEKKRLILKDGVLEYFPHRFTLGDMGGLDQLKDWLGKRQKAFTKEAQDYGLQRPKGILAMGVSGCGKSLSAKVISSQWNLPLFRLDMNLVYSGMSGSPELVFSRALKTMDSVAPAVLWLDEIESGISDKQGDSASSRILGYFLTWMQEHTSEVFVAATANRIDLLPAELLRRGRFDQIFFIDLPTRREREEIFTIHLKKTNNIPHEFNIPQLAQITKGWSGSEIEQAIISAMFEAFNDNRKMSEDDLFVIFGTSVPLSTTMEEQIKKIRSWAHNRAVRATKDKEY